MTRYKVLSVIRKLYDIPIGIRAQYVMEFDFMYIFPRVMTLCGLF